MEPFPLVFRAIAVGIAVYWAVLLLRMLRSPTFLPRLRPGFPLKPDRRQWLTICIAGIVGSLGVLAYSFLFWPP